MKVGSLRSITASGEGVDVGTGTGIGVIRGAGPARTSSGGTMSFLLSRSVRLGVSVGSAVLSDLGSSGGVVLISAGSLGIGSSGAAVLAVVGVAAGIRICTLLDTDGAGRLCMGIGIGIGDADTDTDGRR